MKKGICNKILHKIKIKLYLYLSNEVYEAITKIKCTLAHKSRINYSAVVTFTVFTRFLYIDCSHKCVAMSVYDSFILLFCWLNCSLPLMFTLERV
jgi:hypothetical protein